MIYNQNRNLIYFIKAPERYSLKYPKHLVIKALNNLINIAFYTSKKSDYIIHFVNQKAKNNIKSKGFIKVFENAEKFFNYFNINAIDKEIILNLIPDNYLTEIDNFSFEKKISELLSKLCK